MGKTLNEVLYLLIYLVGYQCALNRFCIQLGWPYSFCIVRCVCACVRACGGIRTEKGKRVVGRCLMTNLCKLISYVLLSVVFQLTHRWRTRQAGARSDSLSWPKRLGAVLRWARATRTKTVTKDSTAAPFYRTSAAGAAARIQVSSFRASPAINLWCRGDDKEGPFQISCFVRV